MKRLPRKALRSGRNPNTMSGRKPLKNTVPRRSKNRMVGLVDDDEIGRKNGVKAPHERKYGRDLYWDMLSMVTSGGHEGMFYVELV